MKSVQELRELRERTKAALAVRDREGGPRIVVCMGTCGIAAGARDVLRSLLEELERQGRDDVTITQTGCKGLCEREPMIEVLIPGSAPVTYGSVTPDVVKQIVDDHIIKGQVVSEYAIAIGSEGN
ncbi:MAG: (2Fe-2S) ferredoxin domain-containing protein [Armatimonadetes bacterium]|nr:(2Fe-2S) ferredoxin domain-containing protein [Armatimonadota bacterium]